jgi:tRNA/tmRNA/rRNA uracil-C5-methylase (TrmA/RlmC/RlmD family)
VGKPKKFNADPFPYHAELELEIADLTHLGLGLARTPHPAEPASQWVVMVPFCLPGERVRARVYRNHKNYSEADLIEVLTPSPERATPQCGLFGACGGCQYQHLNYEAQLKWKQRQTVEHLRRMAGLEHAVNPVIPSPRSWAYRSKITPHFHAPRTAEEAAEMPIGFLRQGTRFDVLDVPACPIATDGINARLPSLRATVRTRAAEGAYVRGATLLLREAASGVTTDYDAVIQETVAREEPGAAAQEPLRLEFLARDFFQNNPFILPAFTGYVRRRAAASGARFLVDAYCGSGLFALSCATAFERVAGIELSASSIAFARRNAAANGLADRVTFQAGDAGAIFAGLEFPPGETAVVIDPPRRGCDEAFLAQLFAYGPRAVVYVSCDPATQMRDLRAFTAAQYEVEDVQPFDLFPQTRHLECVVTLRRGARAAEA